MNAISDVNNPDIREPRLYRHAAMAFHRSGRGTHEIHFQQCSARQVRYTR